MTASTANGPPMGNDQLFFGERLPLGPVRRRSNLLVEGSRTDGAHDVLVELVTAGRSASESTVLVSTESMPTDLVRRGERVADRFGLVCCGGSPIDASEAPFPVSTPNDLTGIGIQYQKFAERLSGDDGSVRVGLDSISTLLLYVNDPRTVFRFLHAFTGRVSTGGGLGVYHIDPEAHDDRTVNVIRQPFDGRVEVRDEDGLEIRVSGLPGQPEGWVPVNLD